MTRHVATMRVYLEDTDAQGVVYNASYFRFLERARTDWLRARGIAHDALRDEYGVHLVLAGIAARFRAPARLDDWLHVSAAVAGVHGARVTFAQEVRRDSDEGDLVCEATAEVACIDARTGRPRRLPDVLNEELQNG